MSSLEIFAQNVKTLLDRRNLRLKDLAKEIDLSESYLSLVLNGTRKNLGDKYKDRIAAFFGVPISQLYSEFPAFADTGDAQPYIEDPLRAEVKSVIHAFVEQTSLYSVEIPFYLALAALSDQEARSIKKYFTMVLEHLEKSESDQSNLREDRLLNLTPEQRTVLLACSLAGNNARIEWVRQLCHMEDGELQKHIEELIALDLISVAEDVRGNRVRLKRSLKGVLPSQYTQDKLRLLYSDLAAAMELHPDDDPGFFAELGRTLVKAGLTSRALPHYRQAAQGYQDRKAWDMAAKTWHELSLAYGMLDNPRERGKCLCKCAQALAENKDFDGADAMGNHAFQVFLEAQAEDMLVYTCLVMGNIHLDSDYAKADSWYKKGLDASGVISPNYGHLLMNLATSCFAQGKTSQAEVYLNQTRKWVEEQKPHEADRLTFNADLLSGLIEFKRRNWKAAKRYYESSIERAPEDGREDLAIAYHNLGMIYYREDRPNAALQYLEKAAQVFKGCGLENRWACTGVEIAKVHIREGRIQEAASLLENITDKLGRTNRTELGWVFLLKACIEKPKGIYGRARTMASRALDIFNQQESQRDIACAALWLCNLLEATGDITRAQQLRNTAYTIYSRNHWDLRELHRECSLLEPKHS
ncbi:MAG: helix-turn-helix domain-containing protein [Bacillota bacterium]